ARRHRRRRPAARCPAVPPHAVRVPTHRVASRSRPPWDADVPATAARHRAAGSRLPRQWSAPMAIRRTAHARPRPGVRPSDLFPTHLFRNAAFLAKLYSEAIVVPTVEVSISSGKGGFAGEPGRGLHAGRRLAQRESGRLDPAAPTEPAVTSKLVD